MYCICGLMYYWVLLAPLKVRFAYVVMVASESDTFYVDSVDCATTVVVEYSVCCTLCNVQS